MTIWSERPIEQARLLNPAFLGALLWSCSQGYSSLNPRGLPYPLSFVAIPVVLHKLTREKLPRGINTSLAAWLGDNPQVHVRFAERAISLVPYVKEGLIFGASGQLLEITSSSITAAPESSLIRSFLRQASSEVQSCMEKAKFVGRWFASSGDYITIMSLWGVAP